MNLTSEVSIVLHVPFNCHLVERRVVHHVDHCSWTQFIVHKRRWYKTIAKFAHTYSHGIVFVYGVCSECQGLAFYLTCPTNNTTSFT